MENALLNRTAIHEVGHAIMFFHSTLKQENQEFSIDLKGDVGAKARFIPAQTSDALKVLKITDHYIETVLSTAVGGEAAEYIVFGEVDGIEQRVDHLKFSAYAGIKLERDKNSRYTPNPKNPFQVENNVIALDNLYGRYSTKAQNIISESRESFDLMVDILIQQGNLRRSDIRHILYP